MLVKNSSVEMLLSGFGLKLKMFAISICDSTPGLIAEQQILLGGWWEAGSQRSHDSRGGGSKWWWGIPATCHCRLSLSLPDFLYHYCVVFSLFFLYLTLNLTRVTKIYLLGLICNYPKFNESSEFNLLSPSNYRV